MKSTKKILAVLLALTLVFALSVTAFAEDEDTVTITIERDDSYDENATGNRDFYYIKVFDATYASNESTGGGSSDGEPGEITASGSGFSYTTSNATLVAALGTWANGAWTPTDDNEWFTLTPTAADPDVYVVSWTGDSDWEDVQAAAAFLKDILDDGTPMTVADDGESWSAEVDKGYYIIYSSEGMNLVAATTDVDITEKNTYPTIEKLQKDEDADDYSADVVSVAIGDVIYYQITVTVPADANQPIEVGDLLSAGLTNNEDFEVDVGESGATVGDFDSDSSEWTVTITPSEDREGGDVVITFSATVTEDALSDLGDEDTPARFNNVVLNYNDDHYVMADEVNYTTYYAGIEKVDGEDSEIKLAGVKFTLKEDDEEFLVTLTDDGYYIPDADGSSEVETDEDGLIIIRGLDDDKEYTLTETETNDGYNLLASPATLTLIEDAAEDAEAPEDGFDQVENNKGAELPSTGGIGTTLFYIFGTILVLGAAVVLITKKRVQE